MLDSEVRNQSTRFFSSTYQLKFSSKSCQWQRQVQPSSKHTFVAAADLYVVTTRGIDLARAGGFNLSNSDLLEANRRKPKGMSTLSVLKRVFSWVKEDPLSLHLIVVTCASDPREISQGTKL